jgi:3-hydroxyisobutyrate dehydrogenase
MTSNSPDAVGPIRERIAGRGVGILEAPAGGGIRAAREGMLQLFVGGEADLFERHRPLLEVLGDPDRIVHAGGHGAGYTVKLLINLLWFGQAIATAEALLLGQRTGIELQVLQQAFNASAAASSFTGRNLDALFRGDYLTSFSLNRICEELETATTLARHHQVPFDLSGHVLHTYRRALARYGPAGGELLAVALLEEEAGLQLRRTYP